MTLATRCPACGTIFRVVPDQLRVSNGWVRCGRCGEAFNGLESMVDLPPPRVPMPGGVADDAATRAPITGAGPDLGAPATPATPVAPANAAERPPPSTPAVEGLLHGRVIRPGDAGVPVAGAGMPALPAAGPPVEPGFERGSAASVPAAETLPSELPESLTEPGLAMLDLPPGIEVVATDGAVAIAAAALTDEPVPGADVPLPDWVAADPVVSIAAVDAAAEPLPGGQGPEVLDSVPEPVVHDRSGSAPSFVVQADRAARWRRPGVRAALVLMALGSAAALAGQVAYVFRDRLAAQWPALRPALQAGCGWLDCRLNDYRQIDALSVESSALVRVEGSNVHRLAVTLRNRSGVEVAAPALDLSLNDAQGRPLARRVLQMADLELPLRTLKPGSELPIQVPLAIGDRQVAGYTVEIFYP